MKNGSPLGSVAIGAGPELVAPPLALKPSKNRLSVVEPDAEVVYANTIDVVVSSAKVKLVRLATAGIIVTAGPVICVKGALVGAAG